MDSLISYSGDKEQEWIEWFDIFENKLKNIITVRLLLSFLWPKPHSFFVSMTHTYPIHAFDRFTTAQSIFIQDCSSLFQSRVCDHFYIILRNFFH